MKINQFLFLFLRLLLNDFSYLRLVIWLCVVYVWDGHTHQREMLWDVMMMMMQIWQFTGTANRTCLIHFMIIVLLSSVLSLSRQHKKPVEPSSSHCYQTNLCVYTFLLFFFFPMLARFPSPNSFSQSKTPIIIILKSERHKKHNMMMRCQRCPFLLFIVIGLVCCCRRCFLLSLYK